MSQSSWKVWIYLDLDQMSNIWKFSSIDERDKINLDETFYLMDECPNLSTMTIFFIIMLGNIYKMKVLYILYILLYSNLHKFGQDDNCKQIPLVCFVTIIGRTTPFPYKLYCHVPNGNNPTKLPSKSLIGCPY